MIRKANWPLWAGFLLSAIAFVSYFLFFVRFPVTRDFPWVNWLLFGLAALSLIAGVRRAFVRAGSLRGKFAGATVAALSVGGLAFFAFLVLVQSRQLPASAGAPRVGQKVPYFALLDTQERSVSLTDLLTAQLPTGHAPRGVLLIFYRGYW